MKGEGRGRHQGILAGVRRETGTVTTIDQVVSGKACGCVCPECGTDLIAKKGQSVTHHFAHAHLPDDIRHCQETALHVAAKTVAAELIDALYLPAREEPFQSTASRIEYSGEYRRVNDTVSIGERYVERTSGVIEPVVPEIAPLRPDAMVVTPGGDIFIEVQVTHEVPPEKAQALKREDLAVLELDFSAVPRSGLSLDDIKALVSNGAPRKWLSNGLRGYVPAARDNLDARIREHERREMALLFDGLRKDDMSIIRHRVVIHSVCRKLNGGTLNFAGSLPISNVRREKGVWRGDIPGAPGTVLTTMSAEWRLNRLFGWHAAERDHPLSLLSVSSAGARFYASSPDIVRAVAEKLTENAVALRRSIRRVKLVDRGDYAYLLPQPITPEMLQAMGSRAYVAEDLPDSVIHDMINNEFAELVINVNGDNLVAYSSSEHMKRFEVKRPSGRLEEDLIERVRDGEPCRVRFVPSLPAPLDGNLFDSLTFSEGELYLDVAGLERSKVHFDRAAYWVQGGVLVTADPGHRGDARLEASQAFIKALHQGAGAPAGHSQDDS